MYTFKNITKAFFLGGSGYLELLEQFSQFYVKHKIWSTSWIKNKTKNKSDLTLNQDEEMLTERQPTRTTVWDRTL